MNTDEKIAKIVQEEKIYKVSEGNNFDYFLVKGVSGNVYEVIYDKGTDKYHCNCDNVRLTPCYHVKAVRIYQEERTLNDEERTFP